MYWLYQREWVLKVVVKEKVEKWKRVEESKGEKKLNKDLGGNGRWQWFVTAGVLYQKNKEVHFPFFASI